MTLDDLIALNDEIAALARAGVPLDKGLAELGDDLPGRLGRYATALAQRTARGESLADAISSDSGRLPKVYRAIVEAGVRAGRLPAALETVASSARRMLETYRFTTVAALYPLLVILAAWGGLVFFSLAIAPTLAAMFHDFNVPGGTFFDSLAKAGQHAWWWGPIVPGVVLLLLALWWLGRSENRWTERFLRLTPWTNRMLRYSRSAAFCEVLALLVENQTPLPEAVVLAGEASGDPRVTEHARHMAAALSGGHTRAVPGSGVFPPLVRWLLSAAARDNALLPALRHAAASYHRRARHQADVLRLFLPIVLTIAVGGTVVASYALMLFLPYTSMLRTLAG